VGPARFERRPTNRKQLEILMGRHGEAPLVQPYFVFFNRLIYVARSVMSHLNGMA
jgi:hypothetical protein